MKQTTPEAAFEQKQPALQQAERLLPGLRLLLHYPREWLRADILAGVSVCAILVPQGMAYGQLAGVAPVAGLYTALAAMVVYALFASSGRLRVGPEAGTAILVASVIAPFAAGDAAHAAALTAILAMLVGGFLIVAGLANLGFVADYLSKPVLVGYMNGSALIIIGSQLGKLFGVDLESDNFFGQVWELITKYNQIDGLTLGIGLALICTLVALRSYAPKLPGALIVVVMTALVALLGLDDRLAIVGDVPAGLPGLRIPLINPFDILRLIPGALSVALLAFPDAMLTARVFAAKHHEEIDANQELVALGAMNIGAGLFQGFPCGASQSRTVVGDDAGGQTQLAGIVAAGVLALVLLFLTPLLRTLPTVALGAIIMVVAVNLIDIATVRSLYRLQPRAGWLSVITTIGVLTIGMVPGILIAVILSLFYLISKLSRPHDAVLGHDATVDSYADIDQIDDAELLPGLIVYRFDAQIFFANAPYFLARVRELVANATPPVRWFVLNAEAMTSIDITAADMLRALLDELERQGITFALARAHMPLREMLQRTRLDARIGQAHMFPSVHAAVQAFRESPA
jgi:SulP family sulfate permease